MNKCQLPPSFPSSLLQLHFRPSTRFILCFFLSSLLKFRPFSSSPVQSTSDPQTTVGGTSERLKGRENESTAIYPLEGGTRFVQTKAEKLRVQAEVGEMTWRRFVRVKIGTFRIRSRNLVGESPNPSASSFSFDED